MCVANSFKVTDPSKPGFDPDKFSFHDYALPTDLANAFSVMFRPGVGRDYVDKILIESAGATAYENPNYQNAPFKVVSYNEPLTFPLKTLKKGVKHNFYFTNDGRLINILPYQAAWIFKDMSKDEIKSMSDKALNEIFVSPAVRD